MKIEYDQHFLEDENILKQITNTANINSKTEIIEIGAGPGFLTREILKKNPKHLKSIEIDKNFTFYLEKIKKENKNNFSYQIGNALLEIEKTKNQLIIGNIPYSITEALYKKLIDLKIENAMLLHGSKFLNYVKDNKSRWHYIIPAFYEIEEIMEIEGNNFNHKTRVKSSLVKLKLKTNPNQFEIFIQYLFEKKKRNMKNAVIFSLKDSLQISKKEAEKLILKTEFENCKLELISNENFVKILKELRGLFN